jgi:hypothetical protein
MNPVTFKRRCQRIQEIGCLACRQRGWFSGCQVHHLNLDGKAGQVRRGDQCTIGLCPWHHVGEPLSPLSSRDCRAKLGPSLKFQSRAFREEFGSDDELLATQDELIAQRESAVIGRSTQPARRQS